MPTKQIGRNEGNAETKRKKTKTTKSNVKTKIIILISK